MSEPKVCIGTVGCKLNQFDSEAMLSDFRRSGYSATNTPAEADLCVVNTCAVTLAAERKSRSLLRRFGREAPQARLIAAGCLAERDPWTLRAIEGVDTVLGNREKECILDFLSRKDGPSVAVGEILTVTSWTESRLTDGLLGRTRAYLKIQDGCDEKCTYCVVPKLRGRPRSCSIADAIQRAQHLADNGFAEIVLTGVNLASYGHDLGLNNGLLVLLSSLEKVSGLRRVRLGSIEPWGLSKELIERMADSEIICPHLHLSIQSGDDAILRRMNRRYTAAHLSEMIEHAFSRRTDWGLGADVIVGFPGETDEHFFHTREFLDSQPFTYLHIFPFSLRPGTPAERLSGRVPTVEIARRARLLKEIDARKRLAFRRKHIGTVQQVIPEGKKKNGLAAGYTANYLRVFFDPSSLFPQTVCEIRVEALHPQGVQGRVIRTNGHDD